MSDRLCHKCRWYHREWRQSENEAICLQPDTRPTFVDSEPVFPLAVIRRQQWAQRVKDCGTQGYQWEKRIFWLVRLMGWLDAWSRPHRRRFGEWLIEKITNGGNRIESWLERRRERRENRENQRRIQEHNDRVALEFARQLWHIAGEGDRDQGDRPAPLPGPPGGHD